MRYYVEINGESSLDIQGLMIQSLPSISKPLMRSKQETIDGRDGDIVTKLGYSAYDKTLKISLWGNYDINEVIAFFNQEGEIVFSNEPDKYYRFTILNRDDYVSQLDKFRTCTIALHCQPYKYKLNEEAEELENEYVEETGTSLTFNNTLVAPMNIDLKGNTLQNGTPTPSSPVPINNVSGDNDIVVCGKNMLPYPYVDTTKTTNGITFTDNGDGTITISGTASANASFKLLGDSSNQYNIVGNYISGGISAFRRVQIVHYNPGYTVLGNSTGSPAQINKSTYTTGYIEIVIASGEAITTPITIKPMLTMASDSTYEAYNGTTYNIDLPVENLFDKDNANIGAFYIYNNKILASTVDKMIILGIKPNTTYTIQKGLNATQTANRFKVGTCVDTPANNVELTNYVGYGDGTQVQEITITSGANDKYLVVQIANNQTNYDEIKGTIQIEYGSKANTYTPYGTTPIELCKIGTYQDYFYKDSDKWYLHKEVGKVVLDGSESYTSMGYSSDRYAYRTTITNLKQTTDQSDTSLLLSNYYYAISQSGITGENGNGRIANRVNQSDIIIRNDSCTSTTDFKTWLSTHNTIVNYVLATPTNTEITYTPLINQLESIKNAMSKEGTTNVNQVNNDAPFIITASVLSGTDSITLTNEGNTTSKPTLTITGSGVVGVYLENIQMFNISLGTNETIIIDTENMEAYYGSQLKNRQVTGDYSNFALQSGTNNLKFTGLVTNVEITNYNRWI